MSHRHVVVLVLAVVNSALVGCGGGGDVTGTASFVMGGSSVVIPARSIVVSGRPLTPGDGWIISPNKAKSGAPALTSPTTSTVLNLLAK
jgi:hypothetical protein